MKVIIIGAHGEARQLINRISTGWSVSVIDMDQEKLRNFNPNRQIEKYQGDGTSTLVLKKAGIENASAIVTLTDDDEVNIEALKIAKQNDIFRLSSIVNDQNNLQQYKDLDVEVVDPDIIIGRRLEHILEPRRVVSQAFAGGRAEAIELEINSDSPARGKKLKDIGSDFFIVGALLRKGNVVIPHGDTELETGDLVTIVLQSGAFANVVNLFSGSESRFPLEFGKNVAVYLNNEDELKNLSEAEYFLRNTKADKLDILTSGDIFADKKEDQTETYKAIMKDQDFELYDVQKSLLKEIETNKDSFSIGTVLIPFDEKEITKSKIKTYINFSNKHKIPFLFSRSTFPYKKIGILVSDDFSDNSPVNVAFDLASTLSADVIGLNVTQPKFLQSETTNKSGLYSEQIQDLALSNEVQCEIINAEGNEAKVFTSFTDKIDLSIISQTSQSNWQGKKIAEFVLQNSKSSVLYIPN